MLAVDRRILLILLVATGVPCLLAHESYEPGRVERYGWRRAVKIIAKISDRITGSWLSKAASTIMIVSLVRYVYYNEPMHLALGNVHSSLEKPLIPMSNYCVTVIDLLAFFFCRHRHRRSLDPRICGGHDFKPHEIQPASRSTLSR